MNTKHTGYTLILMLSLIFPMVSFSQTKSIKIYSNFLLFNSDQFPRERDYKPSTINYQGITFAYHSQKPNATFQQIEGRVNIKKTSENGIDINRSAFHIRYEYGKYLVTNKNEKLKFAVSGASKLYYQFEDISGSLIFTSNDSEVGLNITTFANLEYNFSKNIFLELGLSPFGFNFGLVTSKFDNPSIPESRQRSSSFYFSGFNERLLRLGVGYRFRRKTQD